MKYNIITDANVTPGNTHDSVPYLKRLDRQIKRFDFVVEAVVLDSGYLTNPICKGLADRNAFGVIAHRRYHPTNGEELPYKTTTREGYREFKSAQKSVYPVRF